jgi:tripartite ATP-independent transporter DctM subunit
VSDLIIVFIVLAFVVAGIVIGIPIGWVFGGAALFLFYFVIGQSPSLLVRDSLNMMRDINFLAFPLYMVLGQLMEASFLSDRLFEFVEALIGRGKSMMGATVIIFCAVFGAISGSAMSAIAAVQAPLLRKGAERGHSKEYLGGLLTCSCLISMLIPPSIPMILFAIVGNLSIIRCFLTAGMAGVFATLFYLITNFFLSRKIALTESPPTVAQTVGRGRELFMATKKSLSALALPVIVLGGIYGGIMTATEAAAVAVVWIMLNTLLFRRKVFLNFPSISLELTKTIGQVAVILFFVVMFSKGLIWLKVGDTIGAASINFVKSPVMFLLMANVFLIFLGMIMDEISVVVISSIVLLPVAVQYGINPYHFAAIVAISAGIGDLTPPVAPILYYASAVMDIPAKKMFKTILTFLAFGHLPTLLIITYCPNVTLFLLNLVKG